jgi:glutathione S-transferase
MLKLMGLPFSAHTRKVMLAMRHKQVEFELVPVVPIKDPPAEFLQRSPLRKIPVLLDGDWSIPDSSVICAWLERVHPSPSLYPTEARAYAEALWLEELVDGSLAHDVLHGVMRPLKIDPVVLGKQPDRAQAQGIIDDVIPPKLDVIQRALQGTYAVGDALSIADLAIASILINYFYSGVDLDRDRFARLLTWFRGTLRHPTFARVLADEREAAAKVGLAVDAVS